MKLASNVRDLLRCPFYFHAPTLKIDEEVDFRCEGRSAREDKIDSDGVVSPGTQVGEEVSQSIVPLLGEVALIALIILLAFILWKVFNSHVIINSRLQIHSNFCMSPFSWGSPFCTYIIAGIDLSKLKA